MPEQAIQSIELLPEAASAKQLFVLLHGMGGRASDLLPLAGKLREAFPVAAFLLADGSVPFDGGGEGRQWFSTVGVTEENRAARVADALPALTELVRQAQDRCKVSPAETALVGFSQGAIMALEFSATHDGNVGRVLAFSGRFAQLPDKASDMTTLHLLHGEDDTVIPVAHAYAAYERLLALQGDVTLDVASSLGHELHAALIERAIHRLQTCIPLRTWKQAMDSA